MMRNAVSVVPIEFLRSDQTSIPVVALRSTGTGTSAISERLATRLGIDRGQDFQVGHIPSSVVNIVYRTHNYASDTEVEYRVKLAMMVVDDPVNEVVLGNDWEMALRNQNELGRSLVCFSASPPSTVDDDCDTYLHVGIGYPDPGPRGCPGSASFDHLRDPGTVGSEMLAKMTGDAAGNP